MEGQYAEAIKPLVPAVFEYRLFAVGYLVVGVVFGVAAIAMESPPRALVSLAFFGVPFGAAMYYFVARQHVAAATRSPHPSPSTRREARGRTLSRIALDLALTSVGLAILVLLVGRPAMASGAALGMGGALIATTHWLARWQKERTLLMLREPRVRWGGGGIADKRDFYVVKAPGA